MLRGRGLGHDDRVLAWQIASAMLRYPSAELVAALPEIAAAARGSRLPEREAIATLAERWQQMELERLQSDYVEVFDLGRKSSLYLSWHQYGDRRQRGMVLLKLKRRYAEHGFAPVTDELPDWLPMALEFASLTEDGVGSELLEQWRAPIELIRRNLRDAGHEHVLLLDLVSATLSRIGSNVQAAVERLLHDGPPDEEVGLNPFGPDADLDGALPPSALEPLQTDQPFAGRAI